MADDTKGEGIPDSSRININEQYEVDYWIAKLGCTPRQLRDAVRVVGSRVGDVRAYLRQLER